MSWVGHTSTSEIAQDTSPPHYILGNKFMTFIQISAKSSSTDTPTVVITATNISVAQAPYIMPVLH